MLETQTRVGCLDPFTGTMRCSRLITEALVNDGGMLHMRPETGPDRRREGPTNSPGPDSFRCREPHCF